MEIKDNNSIEGKNISQADKSDITTPEQDNRKLVQDLAEAMGYRQQQEDIDMLKNTMQQLNQVLIKINDNIVRVAEIVDKHSTILNNQNPQTTNQSGSITYNPQEQKIMNLVGLIKEAAPALTELSKVWKGEPQAAQIPGLDPQTILIEAGEMARENLNVSKAINQAILQSLKKKAVTKLASAVANSDIDFHAPE